VCLRYQKPLIEDALNWYRKTEFVDEVMKQTCVSVVIQSFGHGKVYFSSVRNKINQYWGERGIIVPLPTYENVAKDIYGFWKC